MYQAKSQIDLELVINSHSSDQYNKRNDGVDGKRDYEGISHICPCSIDNPVGKVEEFNGAVDNCETQCNNCIDAACDEAVNKKL